jgi:hypothetical protein
MCSKADFKSKSQNIWQQNSFGEIITHAHCSVDEKNVGCK